MDGAKRVVITQVVWVQDPETVIEYAKRKAEEWGFAEDAFDDIGFAARETVFNPPDDGLLSLGVNFSEYHVQVGEMSDDDFFEGHVDVGLVRRVEEALGGAL